MKYNFAAGASASLNKTISAIESFLEDEGNRPPFGLRTYMFDRLGDLAVKWYRHGFNRGHKECAKQSLKGQIPHTIHYKATREVFTGDERTVHLKSSLKRKRRGGSVNSTSRPL